MTTLGATFITLLPFLIHLYKAVWRVAKLQNKNYLSNRHSCCQRMLFIQLIYSCFLISIFPPISKLHFLHLNTHTTHNSYNFSDEGLLHLKRQLLNSTQWPIYIINSVNNTKLPCYILPLS